MWIYLLVALLSLAVLGAYLYPRKPIPTNTVLVGPSGAGKTALFQALCGKNHPTVTSQCVTKASTDWGLVVDTPGHPKLESLALAEIGASTARIVFMVDATNLKNVGPLLYRVLLAAEKHRIPVLVAANKYDLFSTVSPKKVQQVLEQEINEIRQSKDRGLSDDDEWLGSEGEFKFTDLSVDLDIESGSVRANKIDAWCT